VATNPMKTGNITALIKWAAKQPHPFTACMRSKGLMAKVPDPERRKRICGRLKAMAHRT
jgi:hypothetical protein